MQSNSQVAKAFWNKQKGYNRGLTSTGDKLFSYSTCILQRLPSGSTIGNCTKYFATTSKHQSIACVRSADYVVDDVDRGASDLVERFKKGGFKYGGDLEGSNMEGQW